ncbi:uncharacterized protein LOC103845446 isoform X2 [Brassica rapa]|uniref:Uncharacterized protein n=1 Tax=Brassica campestris TaxID=3711 RepID=A0A8D9I2W9_BRACM|nr:uncharacterized protein LOC103845446 isoform X2 [Brassica rapa]CAG7910588.1 unnamed protein product [Brassica rapa]
MTPPLSPDLPPTMKPSAFLSVDSSSPSLSYTVLLSLSVDLLDGDKLVPLSRWPSGRKPNRKDFNGYGSSSRLKHEQMNESDPINEVVSSVKMLTEMFVRVEKSKMEMVREMEKTRMEMELKH